MLAYVNEPPPSPLERRPNLPPAFDEVVRRAMAKDPSERYPSAGDLGQAALVAAGGLRRARSGIRGRHRRGSSACRNAGSVSSTAAGGRAG